MNDRYVSYKDCLKHRDPTIYETVWEHIPTFFGMPTGPMIEIMRRPEVLDIYFDLHTHQFIPVVKGESRCPKIKRNPNP